MFLKPGVSIEIRKKVYKDEIPDHLLESMIKKRDEKGNFAEEDKNMLKRLKEKYELKLDKEEKKAKHVPIPKNGV